MDIQQLSDEAERISVVYARKYGIERDSSWFLMKLQEEVGELTQAYLMMTGQARTKGLSHEERTTAFHSEIADVLCQTLLLARFHDVDVDSVVAEKWLTWADRLGASDTSSQ